MGTAHDEETDQHTCMATYTLNPGAEAAFTGILEKHWQTLRTLDLVEDVPPQIFRQSDDDGIVTFVEIFTWKPGAVRRAHQHPEVAATWEGMEKLLSKMRFPHYARWSA